MTGYRRNRVPGGTYLFTVNPAVHRTDILVRHVEDLSFAARKAPAKAHFHIAGWVVLPEHLHRLWTLPAHDADFSYRWQTIKTEFCKRIPKVDVRSPSWASKGERGVWQRRFREHTIPDDQDYTVHMDYIHVNPAKHGLVADVTHWPYSSFRRCIDAGVYPAEWIGEPLAGCRA